MNHSLYYKKHVFFCINERSDGKQCCNDSGATNLQLYAKKRLKDLNLNGFGKTRINKSGCLNRCDEGPVLVVYPEGTWYTYIDEDDIDEIIDSDLIKNEIVNRLKI